ncbi:MAG: hypothetical protein EPO36_11665 [Chloroflexota bacterium]|nr:MAG: hypothetical protein EPO36_11665 [Chloroflexota bacterium]
MRSHPGSRTRSLLGGLLATALAACGPGGAASPTATATPEPASTPAMTTLATPVPSRGALPSFTADEPLVLYALRTDLGGGIFVTKPDGTARRQLATDVLPGIHKAPDWSPDGQAVVFVDEVIQQLWIAHLDGSPTELVPGCADAICDNPAWSPDGTRIAFGRIEDTGLLEGPEAIAIEVVDLATGTVQTVVRLERPLLADVPRWSPDGSRLVVQVDQMDEAAIETGATIAIVPAAGGEPRYLTSFDVFASSPDWGWVTDEIIYSVELLGLRASADPGNETWDLFGIQPDGSGQRRITNLPDGEHLLAPRWTPDGSGLVAKQLQLETMTGGGRRIDPTTGHVEPFLTGLEETRPLPRPTADAS